MSDLLAKLAKFNEGAANIARSGYRPAEGQNRSKVIALIIKVDNPSQPKDFNFTWTKQGGGAAPAFTVTPKYEMLSDEAHRGEQWFGDTFTIINLTQAEMDKVVNGKKRVPDVKGCNQQMRNQIQVNGLRDYLSALLGYAVSDTDPDAADTTAALKDAEEKIEAATSSGTPIQLDLTVLKYRPGEVGTQWEGKSFFDGETIKKRVDLPQSVTA